MRGQRRLGATLKHFWTVKVAKRIKRIAYIGLDYAILLSGGES